VKGAIESSLGRAGLKMARMIPLSEGDLQLTFSNVPYGAWASWLAGIERELGARATTVVVTGKEGAPGNVDAELALRLARK
jgi:type II secretory pathway component PulM